ncbi:MAG: methyltransferase domain-containing protein [Anaerolineales bacterium]|nr:methyltransferase domain-containing protein [Anaerolineales bacterium]
MMIYTLLKILLGFLLVFIGLHTLIRIVRHFYKFPIPSAFVSLIDNPFRRRIQPPDETAASHGIQPGMKVLEVGPGNGTYSLAAARRIGPEGKLVTIDIEPSVIERVQGVFKNAGMHTIEVRTADVFALPFEASTFDLVTMIAVIGEIPTPERALAEFHRVLKPDGLLAFSELLLDPDYPLSRSLTNLVESAGFRLKRKAGNFFCYTLVFDKDNPITSEG